MKMRVSALCMLILMSSTLNASLVGTLAVEELQIDMAATPSRSTDAALSTSTKSFTKVRPLGQAPPTYDGLMLATSWPATVCRAKTCNPGRPQIKNYFNLHGLWPQDMTDFRNSPQDCSDVLITAGQMPDDVYYQFTNYWNALFGEEYRLINHEWTKHGSCWNAKPKDMNQIPEEIKNTITRAIETNGRSVRDHQHNYILIAIDLAKKYNHYNALATNGIFPSNVKPVSKSDILAAIQSYYNVQSFTILCEKTSKLSGQSLLSEIRICLDLNYLPIECDSLIVKCPQQIIYPEWI